jgi:hypothetical protein
MYMFIEILQNVIKCDLFDVLYIRLKISIKYHKIILSNQ